MICKVEIWRDKKIIDTYTSESVWECVKWLHREYLSYCDDDGFGCNIKVYIGGIELTVSEKYNFGFYM